MGIESKRAAGGLIPSIISLRVNYFIFHLTGAGIWVICLIQVTTWVIAFFVLKFANFRYRGNRGRSEHFLTVTFKQADPQNPLLGVSLIVRIA